MKEKIIELMRSNEHESYAYTAEEITELLLKFIEWLQNNNEVVRKKYWQDGKYYYENHLGGVVTSDNDLFKYWLKTKD